MNILFVINNSVNYGGAERYVSTVSNALVEQGHNVTVVSCDGPIVKYLNKKIKHEKIDPVQTISKQDQAKIAKVIEESCKKHKIDLIHCNSVLDFKAASIVKKMLGIPVVYTAHLVEETKEIPVVGAQLVGVADKVIAVSNFIKDHLRRTGLISRKINLVYHGVDTTKFRERNSEPSLKLSLGIKDGERVIMCVARLYPIKGIKQLIEAIPIILERGNNIKVVLVGDGYYRDEYERLATDLGIRNKVLFLGRRENVEELLSIADIFCLASTNEALSFAILEAMAEGKPVVATKVGGIPEAVTDRIAGLLVTPGNIQELASAINKLLEDKKLSKRLGTNAKNRINENFRLERMIKETLATYEEVLEGEKVYA